MAQQPTVQLAKKPGAPKKPELKPDADEKAKTKYESDLKKFADEQKKYDDAIAKWTGADDAKGRQAGPNGTLR